MSTWAEAPVSKVMEIIDSNLVGTVGSASNAIANVITPLVATCFGIYLILLVANYMRGASSNPVWEVWQRTLGFAVIIGIGLNMGNYGNYVVPIVSDFGNDIAAAMSGAEPGSGTGSQLDALAKHYIKIIGDDWRRIGELGFFDGADNLTQPIIWGMKTFIIMVGLLPFIIIAAVLLIIAKVGTTLIVAIGPLFFACLVFPATRQYFSSWVNAAVSYALIPVFVGLLVAFSINISTDVFSGGSSGPIKFEKTSMFTCFFASIVNFILIYLLKTCQALASQLSAGGINIGFNASSYANSTAKKGAGIAKGAAKGVAKGATNLAKGAYSLASKILGGNSIKPG
jgi:type IV secretion system protein VirB6